MLVHLGAHQTIAEVERFLAHVQQEDVGQDLDDLRRVDVAARRLLTMIDGLGAQKVVRAVPSTEAKHIAQAYVASELGVTA